MPMERENHENLMNELNDPELNHERRTEILQELRTDYGTVHDEYNELTTNNSHLKEVNDDLTIANSKLFRQAGYKPTEKEKKSDEQKEFSESVTLESLEKKDR